MVRLSLFVHTHLGIHGTYSFALPDLRVQIERLRTSATVGRSQVPVRQRASDASLRRGLEAANERIRALVKENTELREQLAAALGELRSLQ